MSFFFPSSPSTSDATVSSLTSSPRAGGVDELATPTQYSETPRSPITATSTTRAPESGLSVSPKTVGGKIPNSNDSNEDNNVNGEHDYGDNDASVYPLSRAASDVYHDQHATHTLREPDRGMAELGVIKRGVDGFLDLMANGEFSDTDSSSSSSSSSSSDDDESVMSGSGSRKGKSRESERVLEDVDTSSTGIHRTLTGASTSSALQGTSISRPLRRVDLAPVPPPDEEESRDRARSHRRRSSGEPSRSRSAHTHSRKSSRTLVVHKKQEIGISRDFVLIVALCVGFACAIVLVARPAIMVLVQRGGGWDLD